MRWRSPRASGGNWRLPSAKEMRAIRERSCVFPAYNPNVFPELPVENFWTNARAWLSSSYGCIVYTYQGSRSCRALLSAEHPSCWCASPRAYRGIAMSCSVLLGASPETRARPASSSSIQRTSARTMVASTPLVRTSAGVRRPSARMSLSPGLSPACRPPLMTYWPRTTPLTA
jgi:hypothetical protein